MQNVNGPLFNLVRAGLGFGWDSLPELSPEEWRAVYESAARQSVQGVVFSAVESLPYDSPSRPPKALLARWALDVQGIESFSRRNRAVMLKQKEVWDRRGVDAVLLKGWSVAQYYPQPERRVSGDVDWWMRTPEAWDKALAVLASNGIKPETDSDGDIHYELGGVVVEHHRSGLVEDGPAGVLFLLNTHILHHAMVMGVGLRQLCDYAVAREAFRRESGDGWPAVLGRYGELAAAGGLTKWTAVLDGAVAEIGLPDADVDPSVRRKSLRLLDLVIADGNFGLDKRNRFGGFFSRAGLLLGICPGTFIRRWLSLAAGRIRRLV